MLLCDWILTLTNFFPVLLVFPKISFIKHRSKAWYFSCNNSKYGGDHCVITVFITRGSATFLRCLQLCTKHPALPVSVFWINEHLGATTVWIRFVQFFSFGYLPYCRCFFLKKVFKVTKVTGSYHLSFIHELSSSVVSSAINTVPCA